MYQRNDLLDHISTLLDRNVGRMGPERCDQAHRYFSIVNQNTMTKCIEDVI